MSDSPTSGEWMALAKDIRNELNSIKNELSTNNAINAAQHATAATERQFLRRDVDKLDVVKFRVIENSCNQIIKNHADYIKEQRQEKEAQKAFIFKVAALVASTVTTLLVGFGSLLIKLYEWFGPSAPSPTDLTSQ